MDYNDRIHDGRQLIHREIKGFAVEEWDGTENLVRVIQVHGSPLNRFKDGVTFEYEDGLQHRVSLEYFCSIVVAKYRMNKREFIRYFNKSVETFKGGRINMGLEVV
jgi:hypothetical protein